MKTMKTESSKLVLPYLTAILALWLGMAKAHIEGWPMAVTALAGVNIMVTCAFAICYVFQKTKIQYFVLKPPYAKVLRDGIHVDDPRGVAFHGSLQKCCDYLNELEDTGKGYLIIDNLWRPAGTRFDGEWLAV